jgi:hypothetical protein
LNCVLGSLKISSMLGNLSDFAADKNKHNSHTHSRER